MKEHIPLTFFALALSSASGWLLSSPEPLPTPLSESSWESHRVAASSLPAAGRLGILLFACGYVAFQKKLLSRSLSRLAARVYFWPTLPFTLTLRRGNLVSPVDETLLVGVAPVFGQASPENLHSLGVRAIVNLCDEWGGDVNRLKQLRMTQLWVPTVDHFEPSLASIKASIDFIDKYRLREEKVYVHCKAGHGRSAAVALCWLIKQNPLVDPESLAKDLESKRKVRKNLHMQPGVQAYREELLGQSSSLQGK